MLVPTNIITIDALAVGAGIGIRGAWNLGARGAQATYSINVEELANRGLVSIVESAERFRHAAVALVAILGWPVAFGREVDSAIRVVEPIGPDRRRAWAAKRVFGAATILGIVVN
jgi:hypothetical protein